MTSVMKLEDYAAVTAIAVVVSVVVVVVFTATGVPGITARAPRNDQVTGQGSQPGQG